MCIRDRRHCHVPNPNRRGRGWRKTSRHRKGKRRVSGAGPCLLYTSDAADERSSVDLGGRRIIKKKKELEQDCVYDFET